MRRTLALALVLALTAACAGLLVRSEDPRLEAWKAQASELRGLEFESSVRLEWVPASAFPEVIRAELDSTYTPESARRYRDEQLPCPGPPILVIFFGDLPRSGWQRLAGLFQ